MYLPYHSEFDFIALQDHERAISFRRLPMTLFHLNKWYLSIYVETYRKLSAYAGVISFKLSRSKWFNLLLSKFLYPMILIIMVWVILRLCENSSKVNHCFQLFFTIIVRSGITVSKKYTKPISVSKQCSISLRHGDWSGAVMGTGTFISHFQFNSYFPSIWWVPNEQEHPPPTIPRRNRFRS